MDSERGLSMIPRQRGFRRARSAAAGPVQSPFQQKVNCVVSQDSSWSNNYRIYWFILPKSPRKFTKHVSVDWAAVAHPDFIQIRIYLIVVRDKNHLQPLMYLLT